MGGGGIQGGGSQGGGENVHQAWEQQYVGQGADLSRQVKKHDQKLQTRGPREKDAIEKSVEAERKGDVTTIEGREQAKRAGKPLTLKSDNPRLANPDNRNPSPPGGPQGTGNPFFNINPMATFFSEFLKMMQMQKQMQLATNQLAVTDAKLILDLAKSQAHAIKKEAEAQASSLEKQAIMSFVQAGLAGLQLLGSLYGMKDAFKEVAQGRKAQSRATATAKKNLDNLENADDIARSATKLNGKLAGQNKNLQKMKQAPTVMSEDQMEKLSAMRKAQHKKEVQFAKTADKNNAKMVNKKTSELNQQRADKLKLDQAKNKEALNLKKTKLDQSQKDLDNLDDQIANTADKKARSKLEKQKDEMLEARKIDANDQKKLTQEEGELEFQANKKTTEKMDEFNDKVDDFNYKIAKLQKGNKKAQADLRAKTDKLNDLENKMLAPGTDPGKKAKLQKEIMDIKGQQKAIEKNIKTRKDVMKKLEGDKSKYIQDQTKALEDDISKTQQDLNKVTQNLHKNPKYQEARAKYDQELTALQNYDRSSATHALQNMQGKPWFMGLQAFVQAGTHAIEGGSKTVQAQGIRDAALWEARKAELQAHQQIMQAAMNAMTELTRDSHQQANELAQTLIKMSDQEAQSMHWAA